MGTSKIILHGPSKNITSNNATLIPVTTISSPPIVYNTSNKVVEESLTINQKVVAEANKLRKDKILLKQEELALRLTDPKEVKLIMILKKAVTQSRIAVKRAETNSIQITRFFQDAAQAAVRQAKVELETNVLDARAQELDVQV